MWRICIEAQRCVCVWSDVQGSCKALTASRMFKRPFVAGKLAQVQQ